MHQGIQLFFGTLITAGVGLITLGAFMDHQPQKYQYSVLAPDDTLFEQEMNKAGQEGWEVVTCRRATSSLNNSAKYECIMKRQQ